MRVRRRSTKTRDFGGAVSSGCFEFLQWIFLLFSRCSVQFGKEITPKSKKRLISWRRKLRKILSRFFMPKSPESEILAKCFADMGEKCGKNLAKHFADFRPSISRRSGRKKIRVAVKQIFFTARLWELGGARCFWPQKWRAIHGQFLPL